MLTQRTSIHAAKVILHKGTTFGSRTATTKPHVVKRHIKIFDEPGDSSMPASWARAVLQSETTPRNAVSAKSVRRTGFFDEFWPDKCMRTGETKIIHEPTLAPRRQIARYHTHRRRFHVRPGNRICVPKREIQIAYLELAKYKQTGPCDLLQQRYR